MADGFDFGTAPETPEALSVAPDTASDAGVSQFDPLLPPEISKHLKSFGSGVGNDLETKTLEMAPAATDELPDIETATFDFDAPPLPPIDPVAQLRASQQLQTPQFDAEGVPVPGSIAEERGLKQAAESRAVMQNFDLTADIDGNLLALSRHVADTVGGFTMVEDENGNLVKRYLRMTPEMVQTMHPSQLKVMLERQDVQLALKVDSVVRKRLAEDAEMMAIFRGEIPILLAAEGAMATSQRLKGLGPKGERSQTPFQEVTGLVVDDTMGVIAGIGNAIKRGNLMQGAAKDVADAFTFLELGETEDAVQQLMEAAAAMKTAGGLKRSDLANEMLDLIKKLDKLEFGEGLAELTVMIKENPAEAAVLINEVMAEQIQPLLLSAAATAVGTPVAGVAVNMATTFAQEQFAFSDEALKNIKDKHGYDLNTEKGIRDFVADEAAKQDFLAFGVKRAIPITAAQAASFGLLRVLARANVARTVKVATALAGEVATEGSAEWLAQMWSKGHYLLSDVVLEAMASGHPVTVGLEAYVSGAADLNDFRQAKAVKVWLESGKATSEEIKGIPTEKLSAAADVLADKLRAEGIERVFIPADQLVGFDQDGSVTETLGLTSEAVRQAAAAGQDVSIDAATYIRHILGADGFDALQRHTRFDEAGMTAAEAEAYEADDVGGQIQEQMRQLALQRVGVGVHIDEASLTQLNEDSESIRGQVRDALEATGVYTGAKADLFAQITAQRYATRAVRHTEATGQPVDAMSLFLADNLQVQGDAAVQAAQGFEQFDQDNEGRAEGDFSPEHVDLLESLEDVSVDDAFFNFDEDFEDKAFWITPGGKIVAAERPGVHAHLVREIAPELVRGASQDQIADNFMNDTGAIRFVALNDDSGAPAELFLKMHDKKLTQEQRRTIGKMVNQSADGVQVIAERFDVDNGTVVLSEQLSGRDAKGALHAGRRGEGAVFNQDAEHSLASAQRLLKDDIAALGLTEEQAAKISPIYRPEVVPTERMASNQDAALWLEDQFEGEAITDHTTVLTTEQVEEISTIMAAEAQLALESTGSALDWYSGALTRALNVAQVKYPMLADDSSAKQAGFGTASNARFAFTYIMAVTSQNLDVAANSVATDKAFEQMVDRVQNGVHSMDRAWGTGDKQEAMGDNFDKFGPMIEAMPGESFPDKLEALDALFRQKKTVGEWVKDMKAAGVPYNAPGQTNKDAIVYGSSALGPKIGNGFWQNLNGNFEPMTIDLWMRRTWGRYVGASIGNPGALPGQRARLKEALKRSRSKQQGDPDHIAEAKSHVEFLQDYLATVEKKPIAEFGTKKARTAEVKRLKAQIKVGIEVVADLENIKAPESYKAAYDNDNVALVAYSKRILTVWEKEYARLSKKTKGKVASTLTPTWARAAKTVITNLAKPLDQVANGAQRKQIEAVGARALEKLSARGIDVTTADLQALLWYPEKDLWGALTKELETDTDNIAIIPPNPLNESYDTAFGRILRSQGHEVEGIETDGAGGTGGGAVAGPDAQPQRPEGAQGTGQAGSASTQGAAEDVGFEQASTLAVDEQGTPLVGFHGTAADIQSFKPSLNGNLGPGFYVTLDAEAANLFAERAALRDDADTGANVLPLNIAASNILDTGNLSAEDIAALQAAIPDSLQGWRDQYPSYAAFEDGKFEDSGIEGDLERFHEDLSKGGFNPGRLAIFLGLEGLDESVTIMGEVLNAAGYDGVSRRSDALRGKPAFTEIAVYKASQLKSAFNNAPTTTSDNILEQTGPAAQPRGRFVPSDLMPDQDGQPINLIQIFESADATTFLHESGHFWLEQLQADMQAVGGQFETDFLAVNKWMVNNSLSIRDEAVRRATKAKDKASADKLRGMTDAAVKTYIRTAELRGEGHTRYLSVAMHEQFARGTENYFASGKAPSIGLASAFNAFKVWINSVYRRMRTGGDIQFSPEVTEVLDRMLASDEEIAAVNGQYAMAALLTTAEEAGMTPAAFQAYQKKVADSVQESKAQQLSKHMGEISREKTAEWNENREALRDTVESEVAQQRQFRLVWTMAEGGLADGSSAVGLERLPPMDQDALQQVLEEHGMELRDLPRVGSKGIYQRSKADGDTSSPGAVAAAFGYADVTEMLAELLDTGTFSAAVEVELDARMKAEFGSIDETGDQEAIASIHGDHTADVLAAELLALRTTEPAFKAAFIRQYAIEQIAGMKLDDIKHHTFSAAERRHAKLAGRALKKGDRAEAYKHQFHRLVNHRMAAEALKVRTDIDKKSRFMRGLQKNKKQPTLEKGYLAAIHTVLNSTDFSAPISDRTRLNIELAALNEFIEKSENEDGAILSIPDWVLAKDQLTNVRNMTYQQFLELHESVKSLERQGKLAKKLRLGKEDRDRQTVLAQLMTRLAGNSPTRVSKLLDQWGGAPAGVNAAEISARSKLAQWDASLLRVEFLLEQIDGEPLGPWHQTLYQPFIDAMDNKADLTAEVLDLIQGSMQNLPNGIRKGLGRRVDVGELGTPKMKMTRGSLIMLALNTGNESNLDKIIRGFGGDAKTKTKGLGWNINEELLNKAFEQFTEEEWAFIQSIWDHAEKLRPKAFEIYEAENGVAPEAVEPRIVPTKFGDMRGGYFPLMYDHTRPYNASSARNANRTALEQMQATVGKGSVNSSMTKSRTGFAAPVLLDFEQLTRGFDNTIHFITHYDAVRNANKVLNDDDLIFALEDTVGKEYANTLRNWVSALAANGGDRLPMTPIDKLLGWAARNTTMAVLGTSYTTLGAQALGLTSALDRLTADQKTYGPVSVGSAAKDLAHGLALAPSPDHYRMVINKSRMMRDRRDNYDREVQKVLKGAKMRLTDKFASIKDKTIFEWGMQAIAEAQFFTVDLPTWTAAYNRALRADPGSDALAVAYADRTVRLSQSSGNFMDLAEAHRDAVGVRKLFTMFYTWFSALYGMLHGVSKDFRDNVRAAPASAISRAATRAFVLLTLQGIGMALLRGELPDWDEEDEEKDDFLDFIWKDTLKTALGTIPVVRDVANGALSDWGFTGSPASIFGEAFADSVATLGYFSDPETEEVDDLERTDLINKLKPLILLGGIATGAPAIQANRTLDGAAAFFDDAYGWHWGDLIRGYDEDRALRRSR